MPVIHGGGEALSEQALSTWEAAHELVLPPEYRAFLLAHNGGRPVPSRFDVPKWPGKVSGVGDFLGIRPNGPCDIDACHDDVRDRLPPELLPIGHDPGGNIICIAIAGPRYGKVYYWDSSPDWGLTEGTGTVFKIAEDFDQFLKSLR